MRYDDWLMKGTKVAGVWGTCWHMFVCVVGGWVAWNDQPVGVLCIVGC